MKHRQSKLRQFHKNNHGFTLVEMIVSFALIGLFMVAATKVIINTISVYYEAKGTESGMQVCSILTAKIRGEVEGAVTERLTTDDDSANYAMLVGNDATISNLITSGNTGIQFTNADNCHVYIGVNKSKYLVIHYYGGEDTGRITSGTNTNIITEEKDWTFDKNMYLGYTVSSLNFSIPSGDVYNSNVIRMELTVYSPRYGYYTATEYIECYNFDKESNTLIKKATTK